MRRVSGQPHSSGALGRGHLKVVETTPQQPVPRVLEVLHNNGWRTEQLAASLAAHSAAPNQTTPWPLQHAIAAEVVLAHARIASYVRHTPLEPSHWLSGLPPGGGCTAFLKLESEQHTGSFKVRGAANTLLLACAQVEGSAAAADNAACGGAASGRPVAAYYAASTGNHALAVLHAYKAVVQGQGQGGKPTAAAQPAGMPQQSAPPPLTLYLPATASKYKVDKLRQLGADVVQIGNDCLEAETAARAEAQRVGGLYVSPYNDPRVVAGQGTIALELLLDRKAGELDAVLVPVGGGGLISGIGALLKAVDPRIQVIGCQPAASDVMARSVAAGAVQPEDLAAPPTLSDATAGGVEDDSVTLPLCSACVDEWVTLQEDEIAEAVVSLLEQHSKLVEGAAGCALAAFSKLAGRFSGKSVVVLCCGGNIALPALQRAINAVRPLQPDHLG